MKSNWFLRLSLALGLIFFYTPIVLLMVYSFNASPLVNLWGGFSTYWYKVLAHDDSLIASALLSIEIAVCASSIALVLGMMSAIALKRYGYFPGRYFFYGMTITPIVLPDVVMGLALLLMFIGFNSLIGFPASYGFGTILIAHVTFCTAYVTIVLQARLNSLDRSTEEAAMDLGAKPTKVFFCITLPQITSSLVAAWLLSFTLSIDNLVVTTFVAGPADTTLPMYIFATIKNGVTPEVNALATIMLSTIAVILICSALLLPRYVKKNLKYKKA